MSTRVEKRHSTWNVLFGEGRAKPSLLLWSAFLPTVLILYLILNWLPTLVVAKGFDRSIAPQSAMAFNFVAVAGAMLFARLVDKHGTRTPLVVAYVGLIVTLMALGAATNQAVILFLSGAIGIFPARRELRAVWSGGLVLSAGDARHGIRRECRDESRGVDHRADAGGRVAGRRGDGHECRSVHGADCGGGGCGGGDAQLLSAGGVAQQG